jgi:pyruvate kinase
MCLYWGVAPLHLPESRDASELLERVTAWTRSRGLLHSGDRLVLLASTHWTATGHNMIVVDVVR